MLDKEAALRRMNEMPIDELQDLIREALDDSGIEYSTDPNAEGITLGEFFKGLTEEISKGP